MGTRVRLMTACLLGASALPSLAVPVAQGASDPPPCRVRNVTRDTFGGSLIRMVEQARDGDRLRVRGTCPGTVVIGVDLVIRGADDTAILTGRDRARVVVVRGGATVTLRALAIQRGRALFQGGGITNRGRLAVVDSIVRASTSERGSGGGIENLGQATLIRSIVRRNDGYSGGGIINHGTLTLTDSIVSGNTARNAGGGIYSVEGTNLTISGSTVSGNRAPAGGGIAGYWDSVLTISGSSVSGNRARGGGGIASYNSLTITGSTVSGNSVGRDGSGGGISVVYGTASLTDSTISANTTGEDGRGGGIAIDGYVTVDGSTISANTTGAGGTGGGVWNIGTLKLTGSTVSGNTADIGGGGIWNYRDPGYPEDDGTVTVDVTSSVTGNLPDDCYGTDAC